MENGVVVKIENVQGQKLISAGIYRKGMVFPYDEFQSDLEDIYMTYGIIADIDAFPTDTTAMVRFYKDDETMVHFGYLNVSIFLNNPKKLLEDLFNY